MSTATAKMIYADKQIAQDILGKLIEASPTTLYDLFKLPTGWQVVRVSKCPDFMPKEIPVPVIWKTSAAQAELDKAENNLAALLGTVAPAAVKPAKASSSGKLYKVTVELSQKTPKRFYFKAPFGPGKAHRLHADYVVASEQVEGDVYALTVTEAVYRGQLGFKGEEHLVQATAAEALAA